MMLSLLTIILLAQATFAAPLIRRGAPTAKDIARLAPDLGAVAGINPSGRGDCEGPKGPDGKSVRIPCTCPPARDAFIKALTANVLAGQAANKAKVAFPTGDSVGDKQARIMASLITVQNLNGPNKGCPAASTTLPVQLMNLEKASKAKKQHRRSSRLDRRAPPKLPSKNDFTKKLTSNVQTGQKSTPANFPTGSSSADKLARLNASVVTLQNHHRRRQPNRLDRRGGNKIPCNSAPSKDDFMKKMNANLQANQGKHATKFPTGSSSADQHARINAAVTTLQNLNGKKGHR